MKNIKNKKEKNIIGQNNENIIFGRNPVIEAIKAGRGIEKLFVLKEPEGSLKMIISMAKEKGFIVSEVDRKKLDELSGMQNNQGVVALVSPYRYFEVDDILNLAKEKNEDPFIVVVDEVEDPHNLGSIIRSANVFGAHGVIIPKRRSAPITPVVVKSSAGAIEHTMIAKVTNINQTLKELKEKGLWIIGTDAEGDVCYNKDLKGPIAVVIGSEGKGISRLVKENCDIIVSIPVKGKINSFNASVAAGIIMYEVSRQRSI